jgi:hypothetical protein
MRDEHEVRDRYEMTKHMFDTESANPETTIERIRSLKMLGLALSWVLDEPAPEWTNG